ncbi:MAG TPA: biotin/lipoyl-containing protein, partial [Chitinophagaceae bacterium]
MAEVILMPRLSDTMTEGVIAAWHKKVGDTVKKGELLAEIETDKATMDLESYKDGTLLHIGGEKGSKIEVDQLLAIIGKPGEDISGMLKGNNGQQKAEPQKQDKAKSEPAKQEAPSPSKKEPQPQQSTIDISKMEEVVLMPRLSDTMTEGVIAGWHKKVGDEVKKGDVLADIETDKATMELESYKNGKLLYQGAKQGEKIQVNDLLCIIGEEGKVDVDAVVAAAKSGQAGQSSQSSTPAEETSEAQEGAKSVEEHQPESTSPDGRVKASPLAKKLAKEKGIDLSRVQGTGDNGRITKSDIDNYKPAEKAATGAQGGVSQAATQPIVSGEEGYKDIDLSQMRKVIAKRLGESKFSAPHFYLTMEINMDNAMQARAQ